jgi:hypothetical protein
MTTQATFMMLCVIFRQLTYTILIFETMLPILEECVYGNSRIARRSSTRVISKPCIENAMELSCVSLMFSMHIRYKN